MRALSEEQRQRIREMDVEPRAKVVFSRLKGKYNPNPHSRGFFYNVRDLKKEIFPSGQDNQSNSDYTKLLEAIALLERRGLVVRDIPEQPWGSIGKNYFSVFSPLSAGSLTLTMKCFSWWTNPKKLLMLLRRRLETLIASLGNTISKACAPTNRGCTSRL